MSMREELQKEMTNLIIGVVLEEGRAVLPDESIYGWNDGFADLHIKGFDEETRKLDDSLSCNWVRRSETDYLEKQNYEFNGTDNGNTDAVIDVSPVDCKCGKYKNYKIRYYGTLSEFIPKLFFGDNLLEKFD